MAQSCFGNPYVRCCPFPKFVANDWILMIWICPPPNSGKQRFALGFPTKHVLVLVVTLPGAGVDPIDTAFRTSCSEGDKKHASWV